MTVWYIGIPIVLLALGLFHKYIAVDYLLARKRPYLDTPYVLAVPWATLFFGTLLWINMFASKEYFEGVKQSYVQCILYLIA